MRKHEHGRARRPWRPEPFGLHSIQDLPYLGVRGDVVHTEDRLQITAVKGRGLTSATRELRLVDRRLYNDECARAQAMATRIYRKGRINARSVLMLSFKEGKPSGVDNSPEIWDDRSHV